MQPRGRPRSNAFRIQLVARGAGTVHLAASGDLDLGTAGYLRRALAEVGASEALLLDLRGVAFIDCAAMRVLEQAGADRGRGFTLVPPPAQVQRVLQVAGLERTLNFVRAPLRAVSTVRAAA